MFADKDRPSTWKKYDESFCQKCRAGCCTMPVEIQASDLIRLGLTTEDELSISVKKVAKRLIKSGVVKSYREGTEFFMLSQKANDDCYFLDSKTRHCTVYDQRPETCRKFPSQVGPRIGFCPSQSK